jgi:hypothetical protein
MRLSATSGAGPSWARYGVRPDVLWGLYGRMRQFPALRARGASMSWRVTARPAARLGRSASPFTKIASGSGDQRQWDRAAVAGWSARWNTMTSVALTDCGMLPSAWPRSMNPQDGG